MTNLSRRFFRFHLSVAPFHEQHGLVAEGLRRQRVIVIPRDYAFNPLVQARISIASCLCLVAGAEQDVNNRVVLLGFRACHACLFRAAQVRRDGHGVCSEFRGAVAYRNRPVQISAAKEKQDDNEDEKINLAEEEIQPRRGIPVGRGLFDCQRQTCLGNPKTQNPKPNKNPKGFIFQKFNLINTLTAKENVILPMILQDMTKQERELKAYEILKLVDLTDRMNHRPNELSGGQQQRVAIARSMAMNPEVILADEPTGNLDSKSGSTVISFLKKLHKEKGTTIVMVTHDEHIAHNAERIEYIKDGKIEKVKHNK